METEKPSGDVITEQVPATQEQTSGDVITETQVPESVASPATQTSGVPDVDDMGVSYKNRYYEMQRKYDDISKSIPQMIQEGVQAAIKTVQPQQPQYTVEDYQAAMMKDPEHTAYYQQKIQELNRQEIAKTVETKLNEFQTAQQRKQQETQAFQWASSNFPQLNNPNDPLSQLTWQLFNSRANKEPHDFAIAAELAASRLGVRPAQIKQANLAQEKLVQKEREIKQLVKKTALEGQGRPSTAPDADSTRRAELAAALDKGNLVGYLQKYVVVAKEE